MTDTECWVFLPPPPTAIYLPFARKFAAFLDPLPLLCGRHIWKPPKPLTDRFGIPLPEGEGGRGERAISWYFRRDGRKEAQVWLWHCIGAAQKWLGVERRQRGWLAGPRHAGYLTQTRQETHTDDRMLQQDFPGNVTDLAARQNVDLML